MPIYEYICDNCGRGFEKLVRATARPSDVACPSCGASKSRPVPSRFGTASGGWRSGSGCNTAG